MIKKTLHYLEKNFGIPQRIFLKYDFLIHKDKVFVMNKDVSKFHKIKSVYKGILFAQQLGRTIRVSDNAVQLFGKSSTKNTVELNYKQVQEFLKTKKLPLSLKSASKSKSDYIICYKNYPIGIYKK